MNPLISIIIPYYKGEKFIAETLGSVFDQGYDNVEIIIVNDGSPAETLDALKPFHARVNIIHQENQGQTIARNAGLRAARGELIAALDQDDLWTPDHLAVMLPYLMNNPSIDFVRGMTQKFSVDEQRNKLFQEPAFQEALMGSALYRRTVFDRVGYLDETLREGEDFDWNIRLRESDCVEERISQTTLYYRVHETNHSKTADFIKNGQFLSLKRKLDRMRNRSS